MPNSDGSNEKMKRWNREITQEEWDAIFGPKEPATSGCDGCDDPSCGFCAARSREEADEIRDFNDWELDDWELDSLEPDPEFLRHS